MLEIGSDGLNLSLTSHTPVTFIHSIAIYGSLKIVQDYEVFNEKDTTSASKMFRVKREKIEMTSQFQYRMLIC